VELFGLLLLNFPMKADSFFHAAVSHGDCEVYLKGMRSDYRLCLVYHLVRVDGGSSISPTRTAHLEKLNDVADLWDNERNHHDENIQELPRFLAMRLKNDYTGEPLSFSRLKGRDSSVIELLRGFQRYEVGLALLEKRTSGKANDKEAFCCEWGCQSCISERNLDTGNTANWERGVLEREGDFGEVVSYTEITYEDMLDKRPIFDTDQEPFRQELDGYKVSEGLTVVNYEYRKAVIVIYPRSKAVRELCQSDFSAAVAFLSKQVEESKDVSLILQKILQYADSNNGIDQDELFKLLEVAVTMKNLEATQKIFSCMHANTGYGLGISSEEYVRVILSAVRAFG